MFVIAQWNGNPHTLMVRINLTIYLKGLKICTSLDMVVLPLTVFPKKIIGEVIDHLSLYADLQRKASKNLLHFSGSFNKFKNIQMEQREDLRRTLWWRPLQRELMLCWRLHFPSVKEAWWVLPFASNIEKGVTLRELEILFCHQETQDCCLIRA